jgi:hypothetical protein
MLNGISLITTIGIMYLHHCGAHDNHNALPHWARSYVLHWLASFVGMEKLITSDEEHTTKVVSSKWSQVFIQMFTNTNLILRSNGYHGTYLKWHLFQLAIQHIFKWKVCLCRDNFGMGHLTNALPSKMASHFEADEPFI